MKGRETPDKPTDRQCKHCGLYFSRRGIITHERNCDLQDVDGTIIPLDGSPTESQDEDAGDVETVDVDPSPEPTEPTEPTAATDGGAKAPPEPDYIPADPSDEPDQEDEELPDHLVPVDGYLESAREQGLSDEDAAVLEEMLAKYDVVDVEATTSDHIAAYQEDEL
jgi:hypothetical protein